MTKPNNKLNELSLVCCMLLTLTFAVGGAASTGPTRAVSRVLNNAGLRQSNLRSSRKPKITSFDPATAQQVAHGRYCLEKYMGAGGSEGHSYLDISSNQIGQVIRAADLKVASELDPEHYAQGTLFGAYLYIQKLYNEGNYKEVAAGARRLRRQSFWNNQYFFDTEIDQVETGTYYRIPTLQKLIRLNEYKAALEGEFSNADPPVGFARYRKLFQMFVEYYDHKAAFDCVEYLLGEKRGHLEAHFMNTAPPQQLSDKYFDPQLFLDAFPAFAKQLTKLSDWERKELLNKYPEIVGYASGEEFIDLYLSGSRVYLVRVEKSTGEASVYDEKTAGTILREYSAAEIGKNSSGAANLINVLPAGGRFKLASAATEIVLTPAEVGKLKRGLPLPASHPLSEMLSSDPRPTVVWSNPFITKSGYALTRTESFIHMIQKSYPGAALFLDDYRKDETERKAVQLNSYRLEKPEDVYAVIDQSVKDDNVINNLASELTATKINIIRYYPGLKWTGGKGKALFVITGHISKELANLIRKLGEDGYFEGNYVLINSCRTKLTTELVSEINGHFGGVATLQHKGAIKPLDLEQFLVALSEKVGEQKEFRRRIVEALNQSNLSAVWMICKLTNNEDYLVPEGDRPPTDFQVSPEPKLERVA